MPHRSCVCVGEEWVRRREGNDGNDNGMCEFRVERMTNGRSCIVNSFFSICLTFL